jgi:hypothetical protein
MGQWKDIKKEKKNAVFWDVVPSDVLEECIASIFRLKRTNNLGKTVEVAHANIVPHSLILSTFKMEVTYSSEILVLTRTTSQKLAFFIAPAVTTSNLTYVF